jgi:GNAT superfamily N-acetyltransferase
MHIRRAGLSDANTVADIYLSSRAAAGPAFPPGVHPDHEVRNFVRGVVLAERETWLAGTGRPDGRDGPDGSAAVGLLVLDGNELDWLFVRPGAQGRGVGTALLDHARTQRPDGLALWVFVSNIAARRFYERHGFAAVRTTDGRDNEEHAPDARYVWGRHPERTG